MYNSCLRNFQPELKIVDYSSLKSIFLNPQTLPEKLVDYLNLSENKGHYCLIGHSLGTMLALATAALSTEIKVLILFSPFAKFAETTDYPGQPTEKIDAMLEQLEKSPGRLLHSFYRTMTFPAKFAIPTPAQFDFETLQCGLKVLRNADFRALLKNITIPILIIHGRQDKIVDVRIAESIAEEIPGSRLEVVEKAGHAIPFTHAEKCAQKITEFLSGIS